MIAASVAGVIILLRLMGALQLLELAALDQLFRIRPIEPADPRIVLVTINESDLATVVDWPMSDATLARLLQQIKQQQPRVIGLDIFRDLPVGTGYQDLIDIFVSTPNLVGVEKVIRDAGGERIKPPPGLDPQKQVAASDLLLDIDGRIRRNLLSLNQKNQPKLGLGAKLAFMYLAEQDIFPKNVNQSKNQIRFGKALLSPLKSNDGGYVNVDDGGYQILANFRRLAHGFHVISMTDVLRGNIPTTLMRDRIVLIGVTADSLEDRFYTSFSIDSGTAQAGVEVHAQVTSQLLSAALDGRPLLRAWAEPLEWLWITIWAGIGAVLGWSSRSPQRTGISLLLLGIGLFGLAYLLFLTGWWLIIIPALLALLSATIISSSWLLWSKLNLSKKQLEEYAETLEERIHERTLELEQEKELLQAIVNHIPVMMTLYDAKGTIYFVNQELEKVLGWSSENIKYIDLMAECVPDPQERQQILEHMTTTRGQWQDFKLCDRHGNSIDTAWASVQLSNGVNIGIGQDMRERLAAIQRERKQAEEASILDERNRMAREIHDTLAQAFTGIIVHLEAAFLKTTDDPQTAQRCIQTSSDLARFGLAEARRSVQALRPQLLEDGDLYSALSRLASQLFSYTETQVNCELVGNAYALPSDVEANLLRIGQEALTNAAKYAKATEIQIDLVYEPMQCILRIKDNGQGFATNVVSVNNGFGLLGMAERAERMGAHLTIQSAPGQGTEVFVSVNCE
ncbi:MAG TPA: CHASE2 domain-containing protein [Crinalium sp.]